MSNENQHAPAAKQARPTSKVRNIVIGILAVLACIVALSSGGDLEDSIIAAVEKSYEKDGIEVECQKIVNLEEIRSNHYRGTAVIKIIGASQNNPLGGLAELILAAYGGKGAVARKTIYVEDLGDQIYLEVEN